MEKTQQKNSQKAKKSIVVAYALWFFFGFLGGHHFYLKRNKQAFLWLITLGGFGVGLIQDLFRIPEYVRLTNRDPLYLERYKERARSKKPPFSWSQQMGQWWIGQCLAYPAGVVGDLLPGLNWFGPASILVTNLFQALGIALGVYLAGTAGMETTSSFKTTFRWAIYGQLFSILFFVSIISFTGSSFPKDLNFLNNYDSRWLTAAFTVFGFRKEVAWRKETDLQRELSQPCCIRFWAILLAAFLFVFLYLAHFYHHTEITIDGGQTIKLKEAIYNIRQSPEWEQFWSICVEFYHRGLNEDFEKTWQDFKEKIDVDGRDRSLRVLGLEDRAEELKRTNRRLSLNEIRKARNRVALSYHPDKPTLDEATTKEREAKFREAQEAYEILSKIYT